MHFISTDLLVWLDDTDQLIELTNLSKLYEKFSLQKYKMLGL